MGLVGSPAASPLDRMVLDSCRPANDFDPKDCAPPSASDSGLIVTIASMNMHKPIREESSMPLFLAVFATGGFAHMLSSSSSSSTCENHNRDCDCCHNNCFQQRHNVAGMTMPRDFRGEIERRKRELTSLLRR